MASSKWFYTLNRKDKLRATAPQLRDLFNTGKVTGETYVWHKTYCRGWTAMRDVPMLMNNEDKPMKTSNNTSPVIEHTAVNPSSESTYQTRSNDVHIPFEIQHKHTNTTLSGEWLNLDEDMVSVVTDPLNEQHLLQLMRSALSSSDETKDGMDITMNLVNLNEERLSLSNERKLLEMERDELRREQQRFAHSKKKQEMEMWAIKNDYMLQSKKLKTQYQIYKETCNEIVNNVNETEEIKYDLLVKYHKLKTKEKSINETKKYVFNKEKNAQILSEHLTELLNKVQNESMKMEVYAKLCDERCDIEGKLIRKQEMDRTEFLEKYTKLRDEMLSAPWLLLSSTNNSINIDKLRDKLTKTYQAIREERRRFLPIQRKWAKLIIGHAIYEQDQKAFIKIRSKLEDIRSHEKDYKLKIYQDVKKLFDPKEIDQTAIQLKEQEIMTQYKANVIGDKERQLRNDQKLLRLQQRNLQESIMELEYERELTTAQKSMMVHSKMNQETLEDQAYASREHQKYEELKQDFDDKTDALTEATHKLQESIHENDILQIKLKHFEEEITKENDDKDQKEIMKGIEALNKQFEQMMNISDAKIEEWQEKAIGFEKDTESLREENETMEEMIEEIQNRNKELEQKVSQITKENKDLIEQMIDGEQKEKKEKHDFSVFERENKAMELMINELEKQNSELEDKVERGHKLRIENKELKQRIQEIEQNEGIEGEDDDSDDSSNPPAFFLNFDNAQNGPSLLDQMLDTDYLSDLSALNNNEENELKDLKDDEFHTKKHITLFENKIQFEKKMKLYKQSKDLRERSFTIMCDENKMIDFECLYAYILHFGTRKPSEKNVREFLQYMKPNDDGFVSFSKFVKTIDIDGDVVAAFNRFKKHGNSRSKR